MSLFSFRRLGIARSSLHEARGRTPAQRRRDAGRSQRLRSVHQLEQLEHRRVMAFDLVSAYASSDAPFFVSGQSTPTLTESPAQIILRFSPGVTIDAATLGSISIVRSGGAGDPFGNGNDVAVVPGSILVDDAPNQNQVVIRFADTLRDDVYQINVGAGLGSAANGKVKATTVPLRLDLGAFVTAVVPQPVVKSGAALTQARNTIVTCFNREDPLLDTKAAAENPAFYRLIEVDASGADVGATLNPADVSYDPVAGKAILTFASDLRDDKTWRLEIGGSGSLPLALSVTETDESAGSVNSSFTTAQDLGILGLAGATITGAINVMPTKATPAGDLGFPTQPGTLDSPGQRNTTYDSGSSGLPFASIDPATGITVLRYNFKSDYGVDPQGNQLKNAITETQKQRAREIFDLYSISTGMRFIETPNQGLTVVTGDMRAIDPTVTTAPTGLGDPLSGLAIMDSTDNWGASEYGGPWFQTAMHAIGQVLGLQNTYHLPSIFGNGLSGEPVFPGDYDLVQLRQLYPASGSDIDLYKFNLAEAGTFTAETVVARPGQEATSTLDTVLSLYRQDIVNGRTVRTLVARNDDYYGRDSFVGLSLPAGTYFVAVTSTGNTTFNPEASDTGSGGRTDGAYELKLGFTPASTVANTIVDLTGRPLDGDRDGTAGGTYQFWFKTASSAATAYVDKTAAAGGDGSLARPYSTIKAAVDGIGARKLIRIVGNATDTPYLIGTDLAGKPLADGATFNVPRDVTVMIDAGAVFKLRAATIDVGSSSELVSRSGAALQILGTPDSRVRFTSYHDDSVGGNSDGVGPVATGGQWGGIVFRGDSDDASKKVFMNTVNQAMFSYGGGQVLEDSQLASFAPIEVQNTRPTIAFNSITASAGPAIAATPDSFEDSGFRVGPDIRGNVVTGNTINGLLLKIDTGFGKPLQTLDVPARFRSTDIVYVLAENLVIAGGAGGSLDDGTGVITARPSGRLVLDPGVILKLQGSRIELDRGVSQLIAEGQANKRVVFTSVGDTRFGAGGTFDTNGSLPNNARAGDWGGIILEAGSKASIDNAYLGFGGGSTPIEGSFDSFNVIETHQGDLRIANSRIENNASGRSTGNRSGRGGNDSATIFARGAQPIVVANDFRANAGAVISVNANSFSDVSRPDVGRSTGAIARFSQYDDNVGPLLRGNRMAYATGTSAIQGAVVRGEEITVESVWDDTDIVHVLLSEIIVNNFSTATGLRLQSKSDASLVVKLFGPTAGFTASGYGLDIPDRIGGTVQVVGQPNYPVILTSIRDDSVGASLTPLGLTVKDTNTDGTTTVAASSDWRSLKFLSYSNDRNVSVYVEAEKALNNGLGTNDATDSAEFLGVLAPNFPTGSASWLSAQEKSGDDNRRLGFEAHGFISPDNPGDVDVYRFTGYAGSQAWIDIDKTAGQLDSMVELLDAAGNVLARSADTEAEGGLVQSEPVLDAAGGDTVTYQLAHAGVTAGTLTGTLFDLSGAAPIAIQTFRVAADGSITFQSLQGSDRLGNPITANGYAVDGVLDPATGQLTLTFNTAVTLTGIDVRYAYQTSALAAVAGLAQPLAADASKGNDFYSQNPKDAGMRVILPGTPGTPQQYFIRVRSQSKYEAVTTAAANGGVTATTAADYQNDLADPTKVGGGTTSGRYELRVRLRQQDEKPGSTVRYADIRFPVTGIDVQGLPRNSSLTGDTGENPTDDNNTFTGAQYVGNLLQSDHNSISVAGAIADAGDVDWYTFNLNEEMVQNIGGLSKAGNWATMFDIDYGSGFRGDLTLSVFDSTGRLLYVGRDSNVADDQPAAGQGNDFGDLSRGSAGKLDPFIGTTYLPAGLPDGATSFLAGGGLAAPDASKQTRYYVAVSSNERLPSVLNATFSSLSTNGLVRIEPLTSAAKVVEDHVGPSGPTSVINADKNAFSLSMNVTPLTLSDVTLFVSTANGIATVDAMRGGRETTLPNVSASKIGDLAMRSDGLLYSYSGLPGTKDTAGQLDLVDAGDGTQKLVGKDSIPNDTLTTDVVNALAWQRTPTVGTYNLFYSVQDGGQSQLFSADPTDGSANGKTSLIGPITAGATSLGHVTGMAFVGTKLYGVDDLGHLFTINLTTAAATLVAAAPLIDAGGAPAAFAGLTLGPQNLYGGALKDSLFAIDANGTLYAYDTTGLPLTVFDSNQDGVADATSIASGLTKTTGLAFSPLDVNLWHPTTNRSVDAGHGITASNDGLRGATTGGTSMYFGFENAQAGSPTYGGYSKVNGQYGVVSPTWQADLSNNAAIPNTYNLPGGAYGSLTTNAFSLLNYDSTDKPTLYFNYFLDTPSTASKTNGMRDSARVFASVDGGLTWELVATNNTATSTANTENAELPVAPSASSQVTGYTNQKVQQLFAGTGWRQARIDLGDYAGQGDVRLRFDFSTAGELDAADAWRTSRPVAADAAAATTLSFADVSNLFVGLTLLSPSGAPLGLVTAVDPVANTVELDTAVTLAQNDVVTFVDATGTSKLNDIAGLANTTGDFTSPQRGQDNAHEGFYVDDIVVGFAERGEMVTNAPAGQTDFFDTRTQLKGNVSQVLQGSYQLELRHGSEYAAAGSIYQTFDTNDPLLPQFGTSSIYGAGVGDQNIQRQQGQFVIENNLISSAGGYGISIAAGARDGESNMPHPGVPRNLPVLNNSRLVPGVVVVNNVISTSGTGGILFSGDAATGNVPTAAVAFGRIVNNTFYGGTKPKGTGIVVSQNSGPTLLNNLFANLTTGVSVDGSSRFDASGNQRTVVATSAFYNTATQVTGATQSLPIVLSGDPFVNASQGNFYLAKGSGAIDSSLNSLQDRNEFLVVNQGIGIGPSPILAPDRDLYGQLRSDDPAQASSPGLGSNIFKDRGAIDRVDFAQPYATLAKPVDQGLDDLNQAVVNAVVLAAGARSQTSFELQLNDVGLGIDKSTVTADAFTIAWEGTPLIQGVDYVFRYLETTNRVVLEAASVYRLGTYTITATTRPSSASITGLLTDLANNILLPNKPDGSTSFRVTLAEGPDAPTGLVGTAIDGGSRLSWKPPVQTNGAAVVGYEIETTSTGAFPGVIQTVSSAVTAADVAGLVNGTSYLVRVRAVNAAGPGAWSAAVGPVMPLATPAFALVNDTGDSAADGVSSDGRVSVTGLQLASGAAWQVSLDNGGSWVDGLAATSFTLPEGIYPAGTVQVRQAFPAGNPATSGIGSNAAAITITSAAPAITITSDRSLIRSTGTALITFTLSKPSTTFTAADVAVTGGTLSEFTGSGTSYTAVFSPVGTAGGTVAVATGSFADVAGNANTAGTLTPSITIDDVAPSIAIASSKGALKAAETATLTFTLSEAATDFTAADVIVAGGTLSAFTGSGASYSAVFTPFTNSTVAGTVTVAAGAFTDAAGNGSLAATLAAPIAINTIRPTVAIASSSPALRAGQTATITFTLSEPSTTFGIDDVTVGGGTLSAFAGSGMAYAVVFTPAVASTAPGAIAVRGRSFTNAAGNGNPAASLAPSIAIDTVVPTVGIASNRSALRAGDQAVITFTLSEPSSSFTASDVTVAGGTLSGFTGSGTTYMATFMPAAAFTGSGTIGVATAAFTDAAGNPNTAGTLTPALAIDTALPSVTIATSRPVLRSLRTATLTFTLSEPSSNFGVNDVAVTGGTLSAFAGSGTAYTAVFTPFASSTTPGAVSIAAGSFTDAAGNPSLAGTLSPPMVIDTVIPTIAITASRPTLKAGETAVISFLLSKPSTTFTADDVVVTGGALSGFNGSGTTYTATFTPSASSTVPGTVAVAEKMFFDSVNNPNTAGSLAPPLVIDTVVPGIAITSNRAAVKAGETAVISFTLSKPSTTFTAGDITVTGGTLSGFFGSGASYSAIFTPRADSTTPGGISVAAGTFTDAIGNPNRAGSLAAPLAIDTLRPTVAVATDRTVLRSARTATLSFTLSEPSTTFGLNDVVATGGTLSAFAGSGTSYTAIFTPLVSSTTPGAVTIAAGTFTDAAGNPNVAGSLTPALVIDTVRPTVTITSSQTTLRAGETALISFALSKPSTSFAADDVTVTGGTLSGFTGSGATYSALFTPAESSTAPGTIAVAARIFFDAVNNPNTAGALTPPLAINTVIPAVSQAFVETTPLATTAAAAPAFATAFRRINLTFTGPAAGLDLSAFKLYYTGSGGSATAVSLAGAVISGSGTSYSIRLAATTATLRGSYQLDIGGPGTSVTVDGQPMPRVSSFFWRLP
jgi:hypothetical protein